MQWLDVLIIIILCVSLLWGLKTGLLEVAFLSMGIVAGWWLSGRYASDAGDLVGFSSSADAFVSVLSYIFIMSVCCVIFTMIGRVVKVAANAGSFGAAGVADRLTGVALGMVVGLIISGALIIILARLAFAFAVPGTELDAPNSFAAILRDSGFDAIIRDNRELLIDGLVDSKAVALFLNLWDASPRISFAPVIGDFALGLDLLAEEANNAKVTLYQFSLRGA